ncbi:MAG: AMP-binding protein [Acidimicrobiia bacterium]
MSEVVWNADPATVARSATSRFMAAHGIAQFSDLVRRSQEEPEWFWSAVVDFLGIPFRAPFDQVLDVSRGKPWATWFTGGEINLSDVCVDRWAATDGDRVAVISEREEAGDPRTVTFSALRDEVARAAGALWELGVGRGDTVAVFLPMSHYAVVSVLAIARVGAIVVPIFSGYSAEAVATRLIDSAPTAVITADGFRRRGRLVEMKETLDDAVRFARKDGRRISQVLVVEYAGRADTPFDPLRDVWWHDLVPVAAPADPVATSSEEPVLLAYTSGTTGRPKGAIHVHGGLAVKFAAEGAFQLDLQPDDVHMWVSDMGWIMGPWMVVAGLANGATIATYDGAPDFPDPGRLWEMTEKLGITALGISPTLIRSLQGFGDEHVENHDLGTLRVFGSTGEPWNPSPWWWLFEVVGQKRVPIVNISGGTEVAACFLSVNLLQGLKPCSLGGPALGMSVDVFDDNGQPVRGAVGELVCLEPWPSMTRGFWGDPDRYVEAYWSRWPDVWVHGDWASIDEDGFWYLHGRSDDTLNIAGKRVGPAEIESAAVGHPDVVMAAAIGVPDEIKGERIVVYAVPVSNAATEGLSEEIAALVVEGLGKPFRPSEVVFVTDLPRTRSAKIMRRLIKAKALGTDLGDLAGLENPDAVREIPLLADSAGPSPQPPD